MTDQHQTSALERAKAKQKNPHSILYDFAVNEFAHIGYVAPPSPVKPLRDAVAAHVDTIVLNTGTESFVLARDYGWTPLQIAAWRGPLPKLPKDLEHIEEQVRDEIDVCESLLGTTWCQNAEISGQRLFFFFLFLEVERDHYEEALAQAPQLRELIDEPFLKTVGAIFDWSNHQMEMVHFALKGGELHSEQ